MVDVQLHTYSDKADKPAFEQLKKFIRVRSSENSRFVEFDFAIGDPSLFVELIMPQAAFEHFCQVNDVVVMTKEQQDAVDSEMDKWRYGEETLMAKNHNEQRS